MADLFDNPMGLMGFEFVEFASPTPNVLEPVFEKLGFTLVARHRSKDVVLYRQGEINFIVNREPKSAAWYFAAEHGPSACGLAFRVKDSHKAYERALQLGAQPVFMPTGPMELRLPAVKGIGGAPLYLIDRFDSPPPPEGANPASGGRAPGREGKSIYDIDFDFLPGVDRHPRGHGLARVDHLTHNVYRGRMAYWAGFYEKLFNFREMRYFDIKGDYTGLTSKAMTAPDGQIRIPLNEEASKSTGQIEEFLMKFNGEGIQHIALHTDDLLASVDALQLAGIPVLSAPSDSYYRMLDERLPGHGQNVNELQARGILMDGSVDALSKGAPPRLLLQIFSETLLGPVFFEFIQRKGDDGFGEGNFKALFESLERDQLARGVIQAT
jgi:4-hydroxyphenylpyruvate dioxygenase